MTLAENLSEYKITWVEIKAENGIIAKADAKKFSKRLGGSILPNGNWYLHFPNKQSAIDFVNGIKGINFFQRYECRFFTDKQFGMLKPEENYTVPFTKKQLKEVIYL